MKSDQQGVLPFPYPVESHASLYNIRILECSVPHQAPRLKYPVQPTLRTSTGL